MSRASDRMGPDGVRLGYLDRRHHALRRAIGRVREALAGRALDAPPPRQPAIVGQEFDRADMLGRVAVPAVAIVVAVDRMAAAAGGHRGH
jgi:hypothetical protein